MVIMSYVLKLFSLFHIYFLLPSPVLTSLGKKTCLSKDTKEYYNWY